MVISISRIVKFLKSEFNYQYIKNMKQDKYEFFLQEEYKKRTGEHLNLVEPKKYTEKMQYSKLYNNSPKKTFLSDKYLVREWIADKIGSEYLIPLLGVWDKYSDVNFNTLPKKFVLKTNHGSGTNLIVNDKKKINHFKEKIRFSRWIKRNYAYMGDLQLHYKDIEPKIIAEEYIEDSKGELNDYKFLCFDGIVYYCWVDIGRHTKHFRNVYDLNWQLQPWTQHKYENSPNEIEKPLNFEKMIDIAKKLSQGFSQVRVDLYNVDGKIYFGEMTFTNSSGFELIYPEEYNYKLGELWDIEQNDK